LLCLALALLAACVPASASAASEPLRMANLQVEGVEANWHAERAFRLDWEQVPGPPVYPRAVLYRLYDSAGNLVKGPVRNTETVRTIDPLEVPPVPGRYTVEAWLEDAEGRAGPASQATLRFDDTAPAPPAPQAPGWLAGHEVAVLQIGHPAGATPISGIRGYALSLDRGGGSYPCARPRWCSLAETDLPGGVADDTIALGTLPEGATYARVVAVSGAGVASPVASAVLKADATLPQLSLQGLPAGWSNGPVRVTVLARDDLSGMAASGPAGPFTAVAVDGRAPGLAEGSSISTWVTGTGVHQLSYFARDAAGNVGDGELGSPPPARATVRIDEEPPRVSFAAAQDPAEPERIEATVADSLSGPSPDRGSIGLRRAGTRGRFEELPTQVVGNRLVAHWDSDSYPRGKYEFLATGFDLAGNAATGGDRLRGAKMVLVNPLKTPVELEAGFGGKLMTWHRCHRSQQRRRCRRETISSFDDRPTTRTVPFGQGLRFSGRLKSVPGASLGGLEVAVTETFAPGAAPARRTTLVRTEADGGFSLRLAPGPSREVAAAFAGTRTHTRAAGGSVHLDVQASVRLRRSAATAQIGGAPVVFSGRVARTGAAPSGEGLPVELQFRYPGADWSEFRTVETDARGRFRYPYRFSDDDSRGVRFQFRAYIGKKEGWPYEPAFSRPVAVSGR
jgi:hypothetical protein